MQSSLQLILFIRFFDQLRQIGVLQNSDKSQRRKLEQDPIDSHKYKYAFPVEDLPFGLTHIVVVVRIAARKFVLTAYGIERKGGR